MANAYVYILRCADDSFYVGSTTSLELRLWQHQQGEGSAYTRRRGRRPVELIYVEEFDSTRAAFEREKQIQGWSRAKRVALIEHRYTDLPYLAEAHALKRRRDAANAVSGSTGVPLIEPGVEITAAGVPTPVRDRSRAWR